MMNRIKAYWGKACLHAGFANAIVALYFSLDS